MNEMNEIAKQWAEKVVKSEAEAFEKAVSRIKQPEITTDELEQAYRQGYMEGYKHRHSDTRIITIAHHYGYKAQREQFEEECAEAILAAQKVKRRCSNENFINLAEEVADVLIMAEQMRILISQSLIDEFIQKKLERQIRRMNGEDIQNDNEGRILMTSTTLEKIKAYGKTADKQDAMNALLDYYGKDNFMKISEEMALAFLDKLKTGEIKVEGA